MWLAKESRDTKDICMLEQVPDLGLHGFNCITIDASDSASEEVKADIPAGEAHVPVRAVRVSGPCKRDVPQ